MSEFSKFGESLARGSGIENLMDDLGHALAEGGSNVRMLGGGNPAFIPQMEALWRSRMHEILAEPRALERILGTYNPPKGNSRFALAMAGLLQREFGWSVGAEHIAITNGGQSAFFCLFNLLGGAYDGGKFKPILLPQAPEYIGYANQGIAPGLFRSTPPIIEMHPPHGFKYKLNFDEMDLEGTGAIAVSRPCNPSGNVLTDAEMRHLDRLALAAGVPLIVDNAYGAPFPGILFKEITPTWNENTIFVLSLSKFGLPGLRTGIVVAKPEITRALTSMNAIMELANAAFGQAMVLPLIESGEILRLARQVVRPYYERKSILAKQWIAEFFDDSLDYHVHESEGALFLWLWFRGLPINSAQLYERLRARGVLIVPGHFFSFGTLTGWDHCNECIRINFAMDEETVREGIRIVADEIAALYAKGY